MPSGFEMKICSMAVDSMLEQGIEDSDVCSHSRFRLIKIE